MPSNKKKKKDRNLPFLALMMIVKDERHIICEALTSILPYIDYYVISDTGSSDGTQEVIRTFFQEHGIDGVVHQDAWHDFGTNRSMVLQHAFGKARFGWMLDADDLVKPFDGTLRRLLESECDAYQVGIVDEVGSVFYWRTQIFNLAVQWKYEGVLHEYPTPIHPRGHISPEKHLGQLNIQVVSRRLGARNKMDIKDKYRNDAEILLKGLEKDPFNTRYVFYLAQSYRDCEEFQKSVDWYQKRADFGGWYEEVFYSYYMIAKLSLTYLQKVDEGVRAALKAFQANPRRIESLHTLVSYYTFHKQFDLALAYASKIKDIPFPKEDGLFLENELYTYVCKFDYLYLRFVTFQSTDPSLVEEVVKQKPYKFLSHLPLLQTYPCLFSKYNPTTIDFPSAFVATNPRPVHPKYVKYRVFNPSIAKDGESGELWMNIRCSNFDDHYLSTDEDGIVRTTNHLVTMDMSKVYEMVDRSAFYDTYRKQTEARILGYEDIRLFRHHGYWCFLANNDEIHGYINNPQMVYGRLAKEPLNDKEWAIEFVKHLKFPFQQTVEKNWVPMIGAEGNVTQLVYSTQPLIILTPDYATGLCLVKTRYDWRPSMPFPQSPYKIRNSSPYIAFDDGWLALCHVVYFVEEKHYQRIYYNLFVHFNDTCTRVKTSGFFHFENHIVEFCNGMVQREGDDGKIVISYSLSDRIPRLVEIPPDDIRAMLVHVH